MIFEERGDLRPGQVINHYFHFRFSPLQSSTQPHCLVARHSQFIGARISYEPRLVSCLGNWMTIALGNDAAARIQPPASDVPCS
jgi:hypothetical protein